MSKIKKEIEERQSYSLSRKSREMQLSKSAEKKSKNFDRDNPIKVSTTDSFTILDHSSFLEYNSPIIR